MNRSAPLSSTLAALAGVGFAVLFFLSLGVVDPLLKPTDAELLAWWSIGENQRNSIVSTYFMLSAAPLFLVFLLQLCTRLRSANPNAANWSNLVLGAGVVSTTLFAVTALSRGVVAQSIRFADAPIPGPDTLRYADAFGFAAFGLGAIPFAAIAVAAASGIIVRTGLFARWLGWLGVVVAVGSLAAVGFRAGALASPLIILWVVAASFVIWRTRNAASGDAVTAGPGGIPAVSASATR